MRIHHVSIPAHDPERVACVLAELFGARVHPMPHPRGSFYVSAGDPDGTVIEVWPAALRISTDGRDVVPRELPLPDAWPHHVYITGDCEPERVVATFQREGWRVEIAHNGPPFGGFSLVRGMIENLTMIEIGGSAMREQYERFLAEALARQ